MKDVKFLDKCDAGSLTLFSLTLTVILQKNFTGRIELKSLTYRAVISYRAILMVFDIIA